MNFDTLGEAVTSIWTIWAVVLFAGILVWVLRPANRQRFEQDARIPLNDDV